MWKGRHIYIRNCREDFCLHPVISNNHFTIHLYDSSIKRLVNMNVLTLQSRSQNLPFGLHKVRNF